MNAARRAATRRKAKKPDESTHKKIVTAVRKGDLRTVRGLLPKAEDGWIDGYLFMAMQAHGPRKQSKLLEVCDFLLSSGADPNACFAYGYQMCLASTVEVSDYVDLLKRHGAKTNIHGAR